ncbi:CLUMA_CG009053, isoform A [Clunio marinus]|uniref:CLUMA_CG009053, isoform A n=1 Tax=Clunio marinus TaxID=568069 RepID=A0A1J1I767_9DIPT|nr:CLUMA_CG009053, isoform A [Clunio marinus]
MFSTPRKSSSVKRNSLLPAMPSPMTMITRRRSLMTSNSNLDNSLPQETAATLLKDNKDTPKTPSNSKKCIDIQKKTVLDPIFNKIQRDLNSPSATARIRANKALKCQSFRKANYGAFDVPHEQQDILTTEERKSYKPKTISEVFKNCRIYVEVRTGDDNRSAGIKNRLIRDGIAVNEKLYKDTTHVIFKDGLLSTYKNAKKMGIPITTILWIDACVNQHRLVETEKFKISNLDRYEHPELYKRIRRQKSMQPENKVNYDIHNIKAATQEDTRNETIFEIMEGIAEGEEQEQESVMELTLQSERTLVNTPKAMELEGIDSGLEKWKENIRRFTTFTPNAMEQTNIAANRRKTLFFTPQISQEKTEDEVLTPEGFSANSSKTVVFNSTNRIAKLSRRSVYDMSINILDINCKSLNKKEDLQSNLLRNLASISKATDSQTKRIDTTQQATPAIIKKRQLFSAEVDYELEVEKENQSKITDDVLENPKKKKKLMSRECITPNITSKKPKVKENRRRTVDLYFKPEKSKEIPLKTTRTPSKVSQSFKYVVCTNMSQCDKQIIQAAITTLGGKIESEVTHRTTHVVTPNIERTMNVLRGVIRACVIVNVNWIHESIARNKWLDTTIYQHEICDSNKVFERSFLGTKNYKNLTFANRGLFFLNIDGIDNKKKVEYLREVILLCSGSITEKLSDASIIVSEQPVACEIKQNVVIPTHIFDSAMKGAFQDPSLYTPKKQQQKLNSLL